MTGFNVFDNLMVNFIFILETFSAQSDTKFIIKGIVDQASEQKKLALLFG